MEKSILIIGSYPPPYGGIASHIKYLSGYLADNGYNIWIISGGEKTEEDKKNKFVNILRIGKKDKILSLLFSPIYTIKYFLKVFKMGVGWRESLRVSAITNIAQKIIKKKSIQLISCYSLLYDGLMGAILKDNTGTPFVVTNFGEVYTKPEFYKKNVHIINYIVNSSIKVMSVSQHCANCYGILGINQDVEVVYYGIDIVHFSSGKSGVDKMKKEMGISDNDRPVLFVGRMDSDRGLGVLLDSIPEILQRNKNAKIIIVGAKGELSNDAISLGLKYPKNVFVIVDAPFKDLAVYYSLAWVVTIPAPDDRGCMGMSIKEAMIAGKPLIVTKCGGAPEAVIDGVTGILVEPKNSKVLAASILSLIADDKKMIEMGSMGEKRAKELFDKDVTNKKIFSILEKIYEEIK